MLHELTAFPSASTVHAPQTPLWQYSFVPCSPSRSRSRSSSVVEGGTSSESVSPFTVKVTFMAALVYPAEP